MATPLNLYAKLCLKLLSSYRPPPKQPVSNRGASVSTPVSYQQRPQHRPTSRPLDRGNPFRRESHGISNRPRKLPSLDDEEEGFAATEGEEAQQPQEEMEYGRTCSYISSCKDYKQNFSLKHRSSLKSHPIKAMYCFKNCLGRSDIASNLYHA